MPARRKQSTDEIAAENARGLNALASLQPGIPAPGTPTAGTRLHGRFAACSWAGIGTILCAEWEVNFEQEFADGTAHGEYWDVPVPTKQMWTGRAQAYVKSGGPAANANTANWITFMAANIMLYNAGRLVGDPSALLFTGFAETPVNGTQYIFAGSAFATRANFSAPRNGAATQEINLRGVGAPTAGFLAT